ncbi:MAG: hypothetical protein AVDCRST_MAG69-675 [uncultured Solirubrobacteraceae bacterium]|uniref:Probable membrane transporter protein n=1 Tax=uncultured Solirubrobacteraceae bacterium TaxID=1162706 RepID=A0A6J4RRW2_9ACTN|nr:MAG: hypothetical protein AVDCRST_MAG69-675 [uncultured Solirubrobacteraceae bacterium]
MPAELLPWILLAGVTVVAAAVHAALGFGSGPLTVPVLLTVVEPTIAVVVAVLIGMAVNVMQLLTERRRPHVAVRRLLPLWLAALPGCVAGAVLAGTIPATALAMIVALLLILSATTLFVHPASAIRLPPPVMALAGLVTGASAALTGIFGPLLGVVLVAAGERGATLRDGLGASFLVIGTAAVIASLAVTGASSAFAVAAVLLLPAGAGYVLGRRGARRLAPRTQRRAVLLAVLTGAGFALARAAA